MSIAPPRIDAPLPADTDDGAAARCLRGDPLGLVAFDLDKRYLATTHLHLAGLLRARRVLPFGPRTFFAMREAELFVQWGIKPTPARAAFRTAASWFRRDRLIAEDGFIRSIAIGRSGEPGLSIILDDETAYYDATKASRLERLLQSDTPLDPAQKNRARAAIDRIVSARISKYNHAPDIPVNVGSSRRGKVLVVDQRAGDASVRGALAGRHSFTRMLDDALADWPEHVIMVKQHPDAITGGLHSYFTHDVLAPYLARGRVVAVSHDVNPHALFDVVDAVYVVSSGMGFEAVMAGRKVYCYGVPYFAGWGLTEDRVPVPRRSAKHTVEDVFHHAYIASSRYFDPRAKVPCEIEDTIDAIVEARASADASLGSLAGRRRT